MEDWLLSKISEACPGIAPWVVAIIAISAIPTLARTLSGACFFVAMVMGKINSRAAAHVGKFFWRLGLGFNALNVSERALNRRFERRRNERKKEREGDDRKK